MNRKDRFIRLPTDLLEALLRARLNGTQWCLVFWVIRNTYGWNRLTTAFTWYQIAKDLSLDRGGVVRMGNALIHAKLLFIRDGTLGMQEDPTAWDVKLSRRPVDDLRQLWMADICADTRRRDPMTESIESGDKHHRQRGQASSLFRRTIDSSKDVSKIYKHPRQGAERARQRLQAGAAKPIRGKYDRLSQN